MTTETIKSVEERREDAEKYPDRLIDNINEIGESMDEYIARSEAEKKGEVYDPKKDADENKEGEGAEGSGEVHGDGDDKGAGENDSKELDKEGDDGLVDDGKGGRITMDEKRHRDLQSYNDKTISEMNKIKAENDLLKSGQFVPNPDVKASPGGEMKRDAFSPESIHAELEKRGHRPSNEEEQFDNPYQAMKKDREYEQELASYTKELKANFDKIASYDTFRNASLKKSKELYPDVMDENSDLHKETVKYIEEHPEFHGNPQYELNAVTLKASELGIVPSTFKAKENVNAENNKQNKQVDGETYITNSHKSGSSGGSGGDKPLTENQFLKLNKEEQNAVMHKQYLTVNTR